MGEEIEKDYIGQSLVLNRPYVFRSRLGSGGFGTVYKATDSNKKQYAIKVINSDDRGIPCLAEASIMATYKHPHLNQALDIVVVDDNLFIVMELAICDLHDWIKTEGGLNPFTKANYEEAQQICFHITQALAFLHREDIIHGDIKTSNILVCTGPIYKLTDFNLSCHKSWKRGSDICTASYRPLEGWETTWDESIDIWCLGSVLYFCLFHQRLFLSQKDRGEKDHEAFINALYSWEATYYKKRGGLAPARRYYPTDYNSPRIVEELFEKERGERGGERGEERGGEAAPFHELILSCLHPKKEKRPKAKDILSNAMFRNRKIASGNVLKLAPLSLDAANADLRLKPLPSTVVVDAIYPSTLSSSGNMTYNTAVVAGNIYFRYREFMRDNETLVTAAISMMAIKITREDSEIDLRQIKDVNILFRIERDICRRLGFILF